MSVKISIALCTYNGERFLPSQLKSFLEQKLLPDELVVCDDVSTDSTIQLLNAFSRKAPFHMSIVRNERNLGYAQNFAKAMSLCTGDVICLSDQDDIWLPNKLQCITKAFAAGASAFVSDSLLVAENGESLGETYWQKVLFSDAEKKLFEQGNGWIPLLKRNMIAGNTIAIRKDLLQFILPIPELWIHDYWVMCILGALGSIHVADEPLLKYRQHLHQNIGTPAAGKLPQLMNRIKQSLARSLSENKWESLRIKLLKERLGACAPNSDHKTTILTTLNEKQMHLDRCANFPKSRLNRIPALIQEYKNGNYEKFSAGKSSAIKDFLSVP